MPNMQLFDMLMLCRYHDMAKTVNSCSETESGTKASSRCFLQLRRIKSCVRALPMDVGKAVVNSFISRVDYCNCLLAGVPQFQLDRL